MAGTRSSPDPLSISKRRGGFGDAGSSIPWRGLEARPTVMIRRWEAATLAIHPQPPLQFNAAYQTTTCPLGLRDFQRRCCSSVTPRGDGADHTSRCSSMCLILSTMAQRICRLRASPTGAETRAGNGAHRANSTCSGTHKCEAWCIDSQHLSPTLRARENIRYLDPNPLFQALLRNHSARLPAHEKQDCLSLDCRRQPAV